MNLKTSRRSALALLVLYTVDLSWKLAHWHTLSGDLSWWMIALPLTVRFAFMACMLWVYLKLGKRPDESDTSPSAK
jgi:hypothetical protein